MTRRFFLAAAVTLLPALAQADYPPGPTTLTTVDAFERTSAASASITGIVTGESSPRTFDLYSLAESAGSSAAGNACERAALVMMNRPGRFQLVLKSVTGDYWTCKLVRQ